MEQLLMELDRIFDPVEPETPPAAEPQEVATAPSWALPGFADYTLNLEAHPVWDAFIQRKNSLSGEALSCAIIDYAIDILPKDGNILIGSSTGKDSTVVTALVVKVILKRRSEGRHVPSVIVGIADTRAEFPPMAARIETEAATLNEWAKSCGLDLKAVIVAPPPKDRLLVELLGNGKPVPKISSGKASDGLDSAAWCMDRVKAGPLRRIEQLAGDKPTLHFLGLRKAESVRRKNNIERHSSELPFGLSRVLGGNRLGVSPIIHWENHWIKEWGTREIIPWNFESFDELRDIYGKGTAENADAGECSINISQEGKVSNSCSDLSGTRFGCWHCLLSTNKSLKNYARRDSRYRWLRGFHAWIYGHHYRNERRRKLIKASGLDKKTCFPKNLTFKERYFGLMLLRRAEIHSGFKLLPSEDLTAIEVFWHKSGVFTVDLNRLDHDVEQWIKTGKPVPHWEVESILTHLTGDSLGEGIPGGAFFHMLHPKLEGHKNKTMPLTAANLTPMLGKSATPIYPAMRAYVFKDAADDGTLVMITDTPSTLAAKTNTGLLNGIAPAAWTLRGSRPLTRWEKSISDGRNFFYHYKESKLRMAKDRSSWSPVTDPVADLKNKPTASYAENLYALRGVGALPCHRFLEDHFESGDEISRLSLSEEQLMDAFRLTAAVVISSDEAEYKSHRLRRQIEVLLVNREFEIDTNPELRTQIHNLFKEFLPEAYEEFLEWVVAIKNLVARYPYPALVDRLAYTVRLTAVDPKAGEEHHNETRRILRIPEKSLAA